MKESIPDIVQDFFRQRRSRRQIFVHQIYARSVGWQQVNWLRKRDRERWGARQTSWPIDTSHITFTDGDIFADFARGELKEAA